MAASRPSPQPSPKGRGSRKLKPCSAFALVPSPKGEGAETGDVRRLMNHDARANTKVVLSFAGYDEWCAHGLKWCGHEDDPRLLVSAGNDVPVQLNYAHVKPII